MKRRTWWTWRLEDLSRELCKLGNTQAAWEELCDRHDLPAIQAGELAAQCGLRLQVQAASPLDEETPQALQAIRTPVLQAIQVEEPVIPARRVASPQKFIPLRKST